MKYLVATLSFVTAVVLPVASPWAFVALQLPEHMRYGWMLSSVSLWVLVLGTGIYATLPGTYTHEN